MIVYILLHHRIITLKCLALRKFFETEIIQVVECHAFNIILLLRQRDVFVFIVVCRSFEIC